MYSSVKYKPDFEDLVQKNVKYLIYLSSVAYLLK